MWTQFWDMHSGGGLKEKQAFIYIEAPKEDAKVIFYKRFGHSPNRVSCTCCGEDYSISEHEDLAQLTGFHRNCRSLRTPKYTKGAKKGLYKNDDLVIKRKNYLEDGEEPPSGYEVDDSWSRFGEYVTLDEYCKQKDVLVITKEEILDSERVGEVPEQGYVWVD